MSNTALWDKLGKTDPAHTKTFKRAGGFSGTAIKPMWSYRCMTEEFGPCGTGWGINEPKFDVVPGENKEVLVYCTVSIWYGESKTVYGVGGDRVVTHIKANEQYKRAERWESDDEAFKKAFTDAVTNALKMLGVGADVHMGMFDDNKYVNTIASEFEAEKAKAEPQKPAFNAKVAADRVKTAISKQNDEAALTELYRHERECLASIETTDKTLHADVLAAFASRKKAVTQKEAA